MVGQHWPDKALYVRSLYLGILTIPNNGLIILLHTNSFEYYTK